MKVYIGYVLFGIGMNSQVLKVFDTEDKAKQWMIKENDKVSHGQIYDDYGLVEGEEYNYFEMEIE